MEAEGYKDLRAWELSELREREVETMACFRVCMLLREKRERELKDSCFSLSQVCCKTQAKGREGCVLPTLKSERCGFRGFLFVGPN